MTSRSSLSPSARLAFDETKQSIREFEQAKSAVKPFVGEMNDSEFEDADDIYEYAFERMGIDPEDYKDVDGSAYPLIWKILTRGKQPGAVTMAGDSARGFSPSPFLSEAIANRSK